MTLYPNAKINLGLAVVSKRPDGYHNLQTVFLPVPGLHDELEITPAESFSFVQEGLTIDCPPKDNLIIRTYTLAQENYPQVGNVHIRFRKNIPFGAGLGGGSADAAFTLKALNLIFSLGLSDKQMEDLITPLGADCAFFIQNRPRMAEGVGNIFSEVPSALTEQLKNKWLLLVKPDCAVSTADAYRGVTPQAPETTLETSVSQPVSTWMNTVRNDFEPSVFRAYPAIAKVKQQLLDMGAVYAAMSGSGATVFGLFETAPSIPSALKEHFVAGAYQL